MNYVKDNSNDKTRLHGLRMLYILATRILPILVLYSVVLESAHAQGGGVLSGNTSRITGIEFFALSGHPEQTYLVNLIEASRLPVQLKAKMLSYFLEPTWNIVSSSQILTQKDFRDEAIKQLVFEEVRRVNSAQTQASPKQDGSNTEVQSYYVVEQSTPSYGYTISYYGKQSQDNEKVISSISIPSAKTIIYFIRVFDGVKNKKEHRRKTSLHEMVHNLPEVFEKFAEHSVNEVLADTLIYGFVESLYSFLVNGPNASDQDTIKFGKILQTYVGPEYSNKGLELVCHKMKFPKFSGQFSSSGLYKPKGVNYEYRKREIFT